MSGLGCNSLGERLVPGGLAHGPDHVGRCGPGRGGNDQVAASRSWGHGAWRSLAPLCEVQLLLPAPGPAVQCSGMMRAEVPCGCRECALNRPRPTQQRPRPQRRPQRRESTRGCPGFCCSCGGCSPGWWLSTCVGGVSRRFCGKCRVGVSICGCRGISFPCTHGLVSMPSWSRLT